MKRTRTSPFLRTPTSTRTIMRDVLIALLPVSVMAVVQFGIKSLVMMLLGITSAVLFEFLYQRIRGKRITIRDLSAAVTGLLVALSYPVTAPLWIIVLGSFIAIVVIKQLSGGIGKNNLNPAVFSRVLIKILFTPIITRWVLPGPDLMSTATPLEFIGNGQTAIAQGAPEMNALFFGVIGGGIGETVKWAIILGALYLVFRRVISLKIPLATLAGLFFMGMLFGKSSLEFATYHVLSGTAMFAAVFMVTDYSSGPLNHRARVYYGLSIGILTGMVRYLFALPGGIGVAILIMNILAPIYDAWFTPRVFGHKGKRVVIETR
ncbi:MAG: RnfABCDGE type electron transport complex subunit D [Gudongella sp.]|nr:RnfABCDGE type electron transport complex subunit D [Gudongella sp.]